MENAHRIGHRRHIRKHYGVLGSYFRGWRFSGVIPRIREFLTVIVGPKSAVPRSRDSWASCALQVPLAFIWSERAGDARTGQRQQIVDVDRIDLHCAIRTGAGKPLPIWTEDHAINKP